MCIDKSVLSASQDSAFALSIVQLWLMRIRTTELGQLRQVIALINLSLTYSCICTLYA